MKLRWLFDALHGGNLGQEFVQQSGFIKELETAARAGLREDAEELVATLLAETEAMRWWRRRMASSVSGSIEKPRRGEADGAEHAEMVRESGPGDPTVRTTRREVFQATYEVEYAIRFRIKQERIHGEVGAQSAGGRFELTFRVAAVVVGGRSGRWQPPPRVSLRTRMTPKRADD
jgi:hypothetical protein